MTLKTPQLLRCITVLLLTYGVLSIPASSRDMVDNGQQPGIKNVPLTVQELARALGVSPFCADAHFATPCYARLVAITSDSTGKHRNEVSIPSSDTDFHARVLVLSDPKSGSLKRISYSINVKGGGDGGAERFIDIPPDTSIQRIVMNDTNTFLYDITFKARSEAEDIHIELETSTIPFPTASPSS